MTQNVKEALFIHLFKQKNQQNKAYADPKGHRQELFKYFHRLQSPF
jgi:hypothetical protein